MAQLTTTDQEQSPRLDPIEQPDSLKLKLAYWFTRKQMDKVVTPMKVLYARFPESLGLVRSLKSLEDKFTISKELQHLIQKYIATVNGCAFCKDISTASLKEQNISDEKLNDLMKFEESDHFTESEKAALAYADEAARNKHVDSGTFKRLKQHYDEKEIVQITIINAIENFYNLINAPLNIGSDNLRELWGDGER